VAVYVASLNNQTGVVCLSLAPPAAADDNVNKIHLSTPPAQRATPGDLRANVARKSTLAAAAAAARLIALRSFTTTPVNAAACVKSQTVH